MPARHILHLGIPLALFAVTLAAGWGFGFAERVGGGWPTIIAFACANGFAASLCGVAFLRAQHSSIENELCDSEGRFRELAEMLPDIVFETDDRGRLTFLNRKAFIATGYGEDDLHQGMHALDMIVPEERQKVGENIAIVMRGGEVGYSEYAARRKDGTTFPVLVHSSPVYRNGTVIGLRGTVIDITVRKQIETDLLRAKQEAELASRAKSEFLAAVSHELRTPLNAIIGFSEMIKAETFGPVGNVRYRGYIKDINESGQHLLALINDILDLAKIESGKDDLYEEPVNVSENARSAVMLVRQRAAVRGVLLRLEIEDGLPALRADARKLKQVFVNLLTNAIKFTDRGGSITLAARRDDNGGLVCQITDTGIGMAPEDIPKALSQFGQIKKDPAYAQEGTGLGLPLTQAIVEQHGATLELRSQINVGTTATISFPVSRLEETLPKQQRRLAAG